MKVDGSKLPSLLGNKAYSHPSLIILDFTKKHPLRMVFPGVLCSAFFTHLKMYGVYNVIFSPMLYPRSIEILPHLLAKTFFGKSPKPFKVHRYLCMRLPLLETKSYVLEVVFENKIKVPNIRFLRVIRHDISRILLMPL